MQWARAEVSISDRDASLSRVSAIEGVLLETGTDRCGEKFSITNAKCQESWGIRKSHDTALIIHRGRFRNEHCPAGSKERDGTPPLDMISSTAHL